MDRSERRYRDPESTEADAQEQAREWADPGSQEHRPIPIDAPEADALDQERDAGLDEDDRR